MFAIVSRTHDRAKKVQLKLLASCAMATSMLSANIAHAGTEIPPPLTGADTAFQGLATVAAGNAHIVQTPTLDTITVSTANTVINFTPFDTANGGGPISFLPSGRTGLFVNDPNSGVSNFTVLNRIIPTDATRAIRFDGTVQSRIADAMGGSTPGGTILFYSPGGIIASASSVFDVGSLVLSAADITFGPGGTLGFAGATPGTAVDINAGASILAQGVGSYVALVAPRVIQSGSVKSDGSVAYIAAEAVDVTIQNNLFDISFVQGTDSPTAVAHTGSTEFTRATNDASPQRIYVASVAKNDAITSLVSGSLGYTAATSAAVRDGAIILSSGRSVSETGYGGGVVFSDVASSVAPASLMIGADSSTVFNASLLTNATGDALIAPAAGTSITFNDDVTLNADRLAEVRAVAGSTATFGANLTVSSSNLLEGAAARVIALGEAGYGTPAGSISVSGGLTIDGGDGATSVAELKADLGHISVTGATALLANTDNSLGLGGIGNASGGMATVQVGAVGSQLSLASLTLDTSAKAGIGLSENETPVPGNALGGTSQISLGGGSFTAGAVNLKSDASALMGGTATGGTAILQASGGIASTGTITANVGASLVDVRSDATAPIRSSAMSPAASQMAAANATGGNIQLNVVNTTMNVDGDLLLHADATGQLGLGGLQGGTVSITVDNGTLAVGDSINVSAHAEETASMLGVPPGLVKGGLITAASVNNGNILTSAVNLDASAASGGNTTGGQITVQTMTGGAISSIGTIGLGATATTRSLEAGGNAVGGQLLVNITSGVFTSGPLVLDSSAVGGDAIAGANGGSATGGTATVNISGGDATIEVLSLTTDATGGNGGLADLANMAGGNGGSAMAGNGEVNLSGGSLTTAGFTITSSATGGDGGDGSAGGIGGSATGGRAAVLTSENATLFLTKHPSAPVPTPFTSSVSSSATGGAGGFGTSSTGGSGGLATGGTSVLTLAGADFLPNEMPFAVSLTADSNASGGMGGGSQVGQAGIGGAGTGGSASLAVTNNLVDFDNLSAESSGTGGQGGSAGVGYGTPFIGGAGGNGNGGTASITLASPTMGMIATNIASLSANADANGGQGGAGDMAGVGGNAINTGSASITQTNGSIIASTVTLSANSLAATGMSAVGGTTSVSVGQSASLSATTLTASANANAGIGSAQGGTVNLLADGGTLMATNTMLSANGSSSVVGTEVGGRGGTVDVRATTAMAGPTASLSLGATSITANGLSTPSGGMGSPANALAGRINLSSIGSETTSVSFSSLTAATTGKTSGMMAPNGGIFLTADQGSLAVTGAATITSDESVDVTATDTGRLSVGNDLIVNARNLISIAHAGRAMGAKTISAATATFNSGGSFSAMTGTSLRADTDLSITSTMGSVTANDLSAGDDLTINAGYGVTLNGMVRTTGMPMMGESSDISIIAPGAVSVNMIDAAGNFSVSADNFTANGLISAGEDVSLSTAGAITTQTISAGDDVMATSVGGDISVTSAIARGTGLDSDMRGADVRLQSTNGALSLGSAMSNDDIFLTSLGNITASNLTASGTGGLGNRKGIIVDSASTVLLTNVNSDNSIAVRGANVTATQFTAGEDVALLASDELSATTATVGDDFMATSVAGNATLSGITTNGTGPDDRTTDFGYGGIGFVATAADGSNIIASAGYGNLELGTLNAFADIVGSAVSISTTSMSSLTAGRDLSLSAQNQISLKTTMAGRDLTATSTSGGITAVGLTAGDDLNVMASGMVNITTARTTGFVGGMSPDTNDITLSGSSVSIDSATAKDNLSITATTGSVNYGTLTSTNGSTTISAVTDVIGDSATASGLLSITADTVDVNTLTSSTNDVVVNARLIDVMTISADRDALISTTSLANSMITLGRATAGRDIMLSGGTNGLRASELIAGDDINVMGSAGVDISSSTATGTANAGYGGDTSDINISASQIMLVATSARNNVTLTSGSSLMASVVNADLGNVSVDAVTSASIAETRALQGSINIDADSVTLSTATAGTDIIVNYGSIAATTVLTAGGLIDISGTGNNSFTSLNSGGATSIATLGDVTGGSASAGGLLTISATNLNANSLTSRNDSVNVTAASSVISSGSAAIDVLISTGTAANGFIVLDSAVAGRDVNLLAMSGSVLVADAMAGDDIVINAAGLVSSTGTLRATGANADADRSNVLIDSGAGVTLGMVDADATIAIRAVNLTADMLTAGEDIAVKSSVAATVTNAAAGDDFLISSQTGNVSLGTITTLGNGLDDRTVDFGYGGIGFLATAADGSNINASAGYGNLELGTLNAFTNIVGSAVSISTKPTSVLTAGRDLSLNAQNQITLKNAMAVRDLTATSTSGGITAVGLTAGDDINVTASGLVSLGNALTTGFIGGMAPDTNDITVSGSSVSIDSATARDNLTITATTGSVNYSALTSTIGSTTISAITDVIGGSATAGGLLSITANNVDVNSLTSSANDVVVNARLIDATTISAGRDALISTASMSDSMITLGTATAGRDIMISGGTNGISATNLTAGDDIIIHAVGMVSSSGLLRTTGLGRNGTDSDIDITVGSDASFASLDAFTDISITGAPAGLTVTSAVAGDDIVFNVGGDIISSALLRTTGAQANGSDSDIELTSGGSVSVNVVNAFSDFEASASSFLGNNLTAGEDVELSTSGSVSVMSILSGDDTVITSSMGNITLGNANANGTGPDDEEGGSDVRLTATTGGINVLSATAGDEIDFTAGGSITALSLTSAGINPDGDRSNVLINSGAGVTLGTVDADATIAISGASLTADMLTAGEDVAIQTTGSASVTNASAGDDFMITSTSGPITLGTITTSGNGLDDRTVDFGYGDINFLTTPANGSRIDSSAIAGDITLTSLNSAGATNLMASGQVTGGVEGVLAGRVSAGADLSVTADQIALEEATSRTASVFLNARNATIFDGNAAVDFNADTLDAADGRLDMVDISAGRDINLSSGNDIIVEFNLDAGRDIKINAGSTTPTGMVWFLNPSTTMAGNDIIVNAPNISGIIAKFSAGNDINLRVTNSIEFIGNVGVTAGRDVIAIAGEFVATGATAGRDILVNAGQGVSLNGLAGDDIDVTTDGTVGGDFKTTGLAADSEGSNITIVAGGTAFIGDVDAFDTLRITTGPSGGVIPSLSANSLVAGEDVIISAGGDTAVGTRDVISVISGIVAGGNVLANIAGDLSFNSITSGLETNLTVGGNFIPNINSISAGTDVIIDAVGEVRVDRVSAGNNVDSTSGSFTLFNTVSAENDIIINSAMMTDFLTANAGRDIKVSGGSLNFDSATAGRDIIANASTVFAAIFGTTLNAGRDISLSNTGYGGTFLGTAIAGNAIDIFSGDRLEFSSLTSGAQTSLVAGNVFGGTSTAGDALSIQALDRVEADALTSQTDSVTVSANLIDVVSATAALDVNFVALPGQLASLTLGSVTAGRDINAVDNIGFVDATNLTAGDDIRVSTTTGAITIGSALTTGSFNSGYGSDPSDIVLDAGQNVMVGTARARDNVLIQSLNGTAASNLTADRGSITVDGGTFAEIGTANASLGTISIDADVVAAETVNAGVDVNIEFVSNASLGSVTAGRDANVIGMGDANADSIMAKRDVTTMVGGDVSITSGSAGRNLRNSSTNFTASSLLAGSDIVILTDEAADLGTADAKGRIVTNAGTSIAFANLTSGLSTSLVAGTSIAGGNATAGTTLSLNANGGGITFGTLSSGGNTTITAQAGITGTSASAGGALTIDSSAIGVTATSLTAGANSNLTVTASNGGNATIGSADAGRDVSVNASNVSVTTGTAARDIIYAGARMVDAGTTTAGRDIRFTAGSNLVSNIASATGLISTSSAGNSQLNSSTADRIFVVASGDTTIGSAVAGTFIGINTNDVVATTLTAGEDIRLIASGTANITNAQAGDDFDINASAGATIGTIVASATARDDRSLDFNAPNFVVVNSASDGSDIRIVSNSAVSAASLTAGDDIRIDTGNFTLTGTATTRGLGNIDSGSNVVINAAATSVATVNAANDIINNSVSFAGTTLNANGTISSITSEDASLGTANAVQGPIMANSTRGLISFVDLSTNGNIFLNTGGRISGGNAMAGGLVDLNAGNGIAFDSIVSGSETIINGSSIVGGTINSSASIFVDGDVIDLNSATSDFGSIFLSGRDVSVDTAAARFDFVVSPGERSFGDRIAVGNVVVGRDILLSGANDRLSATSLRAGDDIDIDIIGNAKIGLAITDGSFGSGYGGGGYGGGGYGDVTSPTILRVIEGGYGADLSNITLDAAQAMIGTAQAHDNVTLTTSNGTMAGMVVADNGDILINGGTSAIVTSASAPMGNVTINANNVDVDTIGAGIDVAVNFGSEASLGTVTAGDQIDIVGTGALDFDSLTSATATTVTTAGAVTGGTSLAGGLLSLTAGSIDVDRLTSSGSSIQASAANIIIDNASALIDLNVDTKTLSGSSISLGTASAGRDIKLIGGTGGISATALTAGDDIMVAGSGTVTIDNALTTGTANSGYGDAGYGNGTSDIMVDAVQAMIGSARAKDNLALTSTGASTATMLTADRGAVTIDSGTSATIGSATATLGSVTISAESADVDTISAGTNVSVTFDSEATLGAVAAGTTISLTGDGDLDYDSLRSGSTTSISVDGDVAGGSAFAGTSFTATTGGRFAASRTTEAVGLVNISGDSLNVADVTSGTTTSLVAARSIVAGNVVSGTGLNIRSGTTVTTGMLTARSDDVAVVANGGMTIGSATATTGNISLTNVSGAVATGSLVAGNDATVANGGTINVSAVTASDDVRIVGGSGVTVGTASTAGGADGDNDGNDIIVSAMGPLSVSTVTTQPGALANSDINLSSATGSANIGNGTALGNLSVVAATSLTAGTATAGANLTLTGQSVTATALTAARNLSSTSLGATNIADARATGGNLTVTAAGALTLTNGGALGDVRLSSTAGGNITTGTLSSGSAFTGSTTGGMPGPGDIIVMSDGNVAMSGNNSAGRNLNVTAKNQISVSGVSNGVGIDLKSTDIVINSQTGRIGEQGRTTLIQLTNTGTGTTTIGGAGVTGSYSLANSEAQRLFAGDIIITATGTGDTIVDALTLTGATGQTGATGGNIGASGKLRIETPGKLRTIGAATISGLSTANRFQVSASQGIEVDAATGSISLTGAAGTPGGVLELTAPTIVAASQAATTEIAALTDGRAINDRLAINDGAISDAGNFTADSIIVNVSNGFFVQNSGIKELSAFSFGDRRGITVGAGGLTINAASATTRIFVSGRQLLTNGSFLTGVDFLRRQSINGTQVQLSIFPPTPFDPASTVNGCAIINSASCLINIDGGSLARDVVGQSDEDSGGSGGNGSSSDANFVQFQFKNLDEANFQAVIDDPVTGVGNDDLWVLYDAKACADDQSLEGCANPK